MEWRPYSKNMADYLAESTVVDDHDPAISQLADRLWAQTGQELAYIQAAYQFVRDEIAHSADIDEDAVTCAASQVLRQRHGICFAKSHLLAALLRCREIPADFCYQKLVLDDENDPSLVLHGLNGVYLREFDRWIRLDARGNRAGVNAQFSVDGECLAYPARSEWGERDLPFVYPAPDANILHALTTSSSRRVLWTKLPTCLAFETART